MKQIYYVMQTLLHGRGSNLIKVISLGLGLTMSILLFSRAAYEQSFDTCFKEYDNLYQLWSVWTIKGQQVGPNESNMGPVAGAIMENFPEQVECATSIGYWVASKPVYNGNVRFDEEKIAADSLFFRTMGIEVLSGNPEKELMQNDVIFLSESFAKRLFGDENPIGKVLDYGHQIKLTVKGTYADIPLNATVKPHAVISLPSAWSRQQTNYSWDGGDSWKAYVRFRPGADIGQVQQRLEAMVQKYRPEEVQRSVGYEVLLKPIRDTYRNYDEVKSMHTVSLVLAFAILFIVSLNYVLISISSLAYRAKAVGVHKCSGAEGGTIFGMFLLETGIIIVCALLLMGFLLLNFRDFFEDTAGFTLAELFAPERIWVPLCVVAVLFAIGGVMPARLFARIPVTQVFRRYTEGKKGWKRPLLFVQFAGVAFICGLMCMVSAQYYHVLNQDMGYNPERLVTGEAYGEDTEMRDAYYNYFRDLPYVEAVASANYSPLESYNGSMVRDEAGNTLFSTRISFYMQPAYPQMMGMTLLQGSMGNKYDEAVVNETFAEMMRWGDDVIGRRVSADWQQYTVVGLLKDFQIGNFTAPKQPFLASCQTPFFGTIHLRLKEPFADSFKRLGEEVRNAFPDKTIDFVDYEQELRRSYNSVRLFRNATLLAAVTMLFVMLMGLIGYVTDEVRRRSKEIAIRKVNGAEASGILRLLSRDILVVALPAVLIGTLCSRYVNTLWMEEYTEQVSIGWMLYLLVAVINLAIIVGCVLSKAWRIANENPVKSIKSE